MSLKKKNVIVIQAPKKSRAYRKKKKDNYVQISYTR